MDVVGIDNNMREYFFGADASTHWNTVQLQQDLKNYTHHSIDIRDDQAVNHLFSENGGKDAAAALDQRAAVTDIAQHPAFNGRQAADLGLGGRGGHSRWRCCSSGR